VRGPTSTCPIFRHCRVLRTRCLSEHSFRLPNLRFLLLLRLPTLPPARRHGYRMIMLEDITKLVRTARERLTHEREILLAHRIQSLGRLAHGRPLRWACGCADAAFMSAWGVLLFPAFAIPSSHRSKFPNQPVVRSLVVVGCCVM